jgi:crotonobetainyl-CoA:carnitine CoA-transferase CaiB-like acyl-CoA transferase
MILADLGADVLLVERPRTGDPTRRFGGHFEALNRNKRSVALDLKTDVGREMFLRLAATADVVIEGFRPGVVDRLGIGPGVLRERFPELVVASISSFGQTGPLASRGGHDLTMQATAGLVQVGPLGGRPSPLPLPLADISSALFAAIGIVSALLARERSHRGSYVDVSMLDSLVSLRSTMLVSALNRLEPAPYPPDDPGYGVFTTGDGRLLTLSIAGEDHQWRALCEELGMFDLAALTTEERESRADEIDARLVAVVAQHPASWLEERLAARGVGAGIASDLADVAGHEQVRARALVVTAGGADGPLVVRQPIVFDGTCQTVRCRAPRLGQHTRELLAEVGYGAEQIAAALASGSIAETSPMPTSRET